MEREVDVCIETGNQSVARNVTVTLLSNEDTAATGSTALSGIGL